MKTELITFRISKKAKRVQAHSFFDLIWKNGLMDRSAAYIWLAKKLDIDISECHFTRMSSWNIQRAIEHSINYLNEATLQRLTSLPIYQFVAPMDISPQRNDFTYYFNDQKNLTINKSPS